MKQIFSTLFCVLFLQAILQTQAPNYDASLFGFSPEASGIENTLAIQKAVDRGGTIAVCKSGTYKLAGTVYIGSHTTLAIMCSFRR